MKRWNRLCNNIIAAMIGVFFAEVIYTVYSYYKNPGLYDMQSAPWYTNIMIRGFFALIVIGIALLIKYIIHQKEKRDHHD